MTVDSCEDSVMARLADIRARESNSGVTVEVNVDGMLTGLVVSAEAVSLGPVVLAAEICRLTAEAGAAALAEAVAILTPLVPDLPRFLAD